jgi:hypothetical protein
MKTTGRRGGNIKTHIVVSETLKLRNASQSSDVKQQKKKNYLRDIGVDEKTVFKKCL